MKGCLGKLPVDGAPNIERRDDGKRAIGTHTVWMVQREPVTDTRTPVVSYNGETIEPKRVHQSDELGANGSLMPGPGIQNAAPPVAGQIGCNDRVAARQRRRDLVPSGVTLRVAVQQEHWRPLSAHDACEAHAGGLTIERGKSFEQIGTEGSSQCTLPGL
jgi:hypothetical protein